MIKAKSHMVTRSRDHEKIYSSVGKLLPLHRLLLVRYFSCNYSSDERLSPCFILFILYAPLTCSSRFHDFHNTCVMRVPNRENKHIHQSVTHFNAREISSVSIFLLLQRVFDVWGGVRRTTQFNHVRNRQKWFWGIQFCFCLLVWSFTPYQQYFRYLTPTVHKSMFSGLFNQY